MKILYLCTYYHRAMIFRNSMDYLMARGHEMVAFNAVMKGTQISDKYLPIMDDKVVHRECFYKNDRFFYFRKQKKIATAIEQSLSLSDFDLIHSHTLFNGGWAARTLKKRHGVRYIVSVRNTDLNLFLKLPFFRTIARKIVNDASGVQFLSSAYQKKFLDLCYKTSEQPAIQAKSAVITNGLEPYWIEHRASSRTLSQNNTIKLLCVGKIDANKNMTSVIETADLLRERGIDAKVTAIGQVLDQKLYEQIKQHPHVEIVPYLTKEQLIEYYRNHDIYLMPSFNETFGRVYAEAMSQGLPVIYTRGQGFDGLFAEGEVGYSVLPSDIPAMADAVENICAHYEQISKNCITQSLTFNWDTITERLEAFYQDALK